jgi:hypothetical protein
MDKVEVFNEDEVAKDIKLIYVKQKMFRILKESGLSEEEQLDILHKMIENTYYLEDKKRKDRE